MQENVMRKSLCALAALGALAATAAFAQTGTAGGIGSAGSARQPPPAHDTMTPTGRSDSSTNGSPSAAPRNGTQTAPGEPDDSSKAAHTVGRPTPDTPQNTDRAPPAKLQPGRVDAPKP
jgi:hypothetical protein